MSNILEIQNLTKNFRGLKAVNNVSFTVEEGCITGMIGSNGAGKTTVFNMISGVLVPSDGKIIYKGQDITGTKAHKYSGMGIARTFQIMKPLRNMTVLENVISGAMFGRKVLKNAKEAREYAEEILQFTGMYEKKDLYPMDMGTPFKKRLEVARALATDPDLLLLDEHTAALDPKTASKVLAFTQEITAEHKLTTVMITHNMLDAIRCGNRLIMMQEGKIIYDVSGDEKKNLSVRDLLEKFRESGAEVNDRMVLA